MKLKTNILFSLLLCGTFATAQNLKLDILPPSVTLGQDSATVFHENDLQCSPNGHQKPYPPHSCPHRRRTAQAELPQILLNGERAHRLYRRTSGAQQTKRQGKMYLPYLPLSPRQTAIRLSTTVLPFRQPTGYSSPP